jgi:peptidoglycan/xylan/chitin deacetylase (PgdA/CDA1 family)
MKEDCRPLRNDWYRWALEIASPGGRRGRLQIFTYHRVLAEADPIARDTTRSQLRAQLDWITGMCRVLPLAEAVRCLKRGTLPSNAAAITFDDGYRDNLSEGLPVLEGFQVPVTIFLAADALTEGIMWNDVVIEAIRAARDQHEFVLDGDVIPVSSSMSVDALLERLKYLPHERRSEECARLYSEIAGGEPPRLMLTPDEVSACSSPLVDFGAHTVTHPILSALDTEASRSEIFDSKRIVSDWSGAAVETFAYPNGRSGRDFGRREMDFVREAGYLAAVSTDWGVAHRSSSRYALPRYAPWEHTASGFKLRILKTNLTAAR